LNRDFQLPGLAHEREESAPAEPASPYMPTIEAAAYLRRSVAWLLRQKDIPYLPGRPNRYVKADLDEWFERNKHNPLI